MPQAHKAASGTCSSWPQQAGRLLQLPETAPQIKQLHSKQQAVRCAHQAIQYRRGASTTTIANTSCCCCCSILLGALTTAAAAAAAGSAQHVGLSSSSGGSTAAAAAAAGAWLGFQPGYQLSTCLLNLPHTITKQKSQF
jgi:hypothetical protein